MKNIIKVAKRNKNVIVKGLAAITGVVGVLVLGRTIIAKDESNNEPKLDDTFSEISEIKE